MQLATVFQTFNPAEAQLIASLLEASGIPVHVAQEASSMNVAAPITVGGVLVQVPSESAAEARALIAAKGPAAV